MRSRTTDLADIGENDVQFLGWDLDTFDNELARVKDVIDRHIMSGNHLLTYWFRRKDIVATTAVNCFGDRARSSRVVGTYLAQRGL